MMFLNVGFMLCFIVLIQDNCTHLIGPCSMLKLRICPHSPAIFSYSSNLPVNHCTALEPCSPMMCSVGVCKACLTVKERRFSALKLISEELLSLYFSLACLIDGLLDLNVEISKGCVGA